jgi:hypothetical protein
MLPYIPYMDPMGNKTELEAPFWKAKCHCLLLNSHEIIILKPASICENGWKPQFQSTQSLGKSAKYHE